jgi:hypothetical protein
LVSAFLWVVRAQLEESDMAERPSSRKTDPQAADVIQVRRLETEDVEVIHDEASRIGVAAVARALEERVPE